MGTRVLKLALPFALTAAITSAGAAQSVAADVARPAAASPGHVADGSTLDRLVASDVARQEADRKAIRDVLERDEVREVARQAGLDIRKAEAAVATLDGKQLQDAARQAREVQSRLAGGSSITIGTTTLIIILLVVILIIVAVK